MTAPRRRPACADREIGASSRSRCVRPIGHASGRADYPPLTPLPPFDGLFATPPEAPTIGSFGTARVIDEAIRYSPAVLCNETCTDPRRFPLERQLRVQTVTLFFAKVLFQFGLLQFEHLSSCHAVQALLDASQ